MNKSVLLIVDVQTGLIEKSPYNKDVMLENIEKLISVARNNGIEIIYVRHCNDAGALGIRTSGWEIYEGIKPPQTEKQTDMQSDKVFDKKYCSAFKETNLKEYLDEKGIRTIILSGMQTEYCIDTTCRVAFEYGYSVIIPKNGTTTFDNGIFKAHEILNHYEQNIWDKRFASVMSVEEIAENILLN